MRTVLLTTETSHHAYFAGRVAERFPWSAIFIETHASSAPFETHHPFEDRRDSFEREVLLSRGVRSMAEAGPCRTFDSLNTPAAVEALCLTRPDVVIDFGTGKLEDGARSAGRLANLNLHGGNLETYRGLDSHLWAIYHGEFNQLMTTLHRLAAGLDTGDIVSQGGLGLRRGMELHELRSENTRMCVGLVLTALETCERIGAVPARSPVGLGRYYSFMPAVIKEQVVRKFHAHTATL